MGAYDDIFGSPLISSWIESAMFSIVLTQAVFYFRNFPKDNKWLKVMVAAALVLDTLCLLADYAGVYLYVITFWGDAQAALKQYWPLPVYVIATEVLALIANGFLSYRFYRLSKNPYITALLVALVLLAVATGFVTIVTLQQLDLVIAQRSRIKVTAMLWLVSNAVTDVTISLVLVWQLSQLRTAYPQTLNLILRLMRTALQTGMATALMATLMLITFLINNSSSLPTAFFYQESHLYTLTILYNLNIRQKMKGEEQPKTISTSRNSSRGLSFPGGIHVTQHQTILTDQQLDDGSYDMQNLSGKSQLSSEPDLLADRKQGEAL